MLKLDFRDGRPIYEQVRDRLRGLIIAEAIQPGDKMPSVRALAGELAINPNTIQKAYEALEAEGYVYSVPGKGSFAEERERIREKRVAALFGELEKIAEELHYLGVPEDEIAARCHVKEDEKNA